MRDAGAQTWVSEHTWSRLSLTQGGALEGGWSPGSCIPVWLFGRVCIAGKNQLPSLTISRLRKSTLSIASNLFVADEILVALRDILSAITRYHRTRIDSHCTSPNVVPSRGLTFLKVCHVLYGRDLGQNLQLFQPVQFMFIWLSASFLYLGTVSFKPRCFLFLSCFHLDQWIELSPLPCREQ